MKKYLEPICETLLICRDVLLASNEVDMDFDEWIDGIG